MWSIFDLFRRRITSAVRPAKAKKKPVSFRARPWLEVLEDRCVPSTSSIASNFNGTAIAPGSTLWFASVADVSGVGTNAVTIQVTDQTITYSDTLKNVTTPYTISVPNSELILSNSVTTATTTFNTTLNEWVTTAPPGLSGNVFLGAVSVVCPNGLGGGDNPVTWSATFSTDTAGVSLNWQWATAVYGSFNTTYSSLGVKPCDSNTASSYSNSDHAGTPENYKTHVTGGARGTGGTNYTGTDSSTAAVTPSVANTFISGVVFNDVNGNGQQGSGDAVLSDWTVQLYTDTNGTLSASPLQTTTSDALGDYSFSDLGALASGTTYVVAEVPASGWVVTDPSSSTASTTVLPDGQRGYIYPISNGGDLLTSGATNTSISGTGTLTLDSNNAGVSGQVSANDGIGDSMSGASTVFDQLNMTYTPASGSAISFYSYCIDLFHDVSYGQSLSVYVSGNENTAFANGARMAYIYDTYGVQNLSSDPDQAAAVQLALWDLSLSNHTPTTFAKDSDGSYSSGDESVYSITFSSSSDGTAVAPLVNEYLQASIGATIQGGWLNAAANGTGQTRGQSMPFPSQMYDFGNTHPVTIGGTVYQDTNGNGVQDSGEPGITGVTLTLSGTNNLGQSITATTTTASNGAYDFTVDSNGNSLLPGTYQVTETQPSGYLAGTTAVGTVGGTADGTLVSAGHIGSITLTSDQAGLNYNFGDVKAVTVAGTVYQDTNGNGTMDAGEPGIAGVTLTLSGTNGLGQAITATTTTGTNGTYSFSVDSNGNALRPGTYQVTETQPSGYLAGTTAIGTVNGTTDGTLVATGHVGSIALTSGQAGINYNFGDVLAVTISGLVYQDTKATDALAAGDPGIAGVTVTLTGTNGLGQSITATTTTASNGTYTFTVDSNGNTLRPGTYQVTETLPSGDLAGGTAIGTVNGTSDGTVVATGHIGSIALTSGQAGINYDFGAIAPVTIAGIVYQDNNANGVLDAGEPGIAGATLTLSGTNYLGQSVTATTTTAANGAYSFSTTSGGALLAPGTYQITETTPSGYVQTGADVGTVNASADGTKASSGQITSIALAPAQAGISYDFGDIKPIAISGLVYQDTNGNGVLNTGEPGIAGVTLTLSGTNFLGQSITATTTTAANGAYSFTTSSSGAALLAGTYQIAETQPSGYLAGTNAVGTVNGTADGTLVPVNKIGSIVLASSQSGINYDFGDVQAVTIGGTVYQDTNASGVLIAGDAGIAGVTLTLTGTNGLGQSITATTTTASNGAYSFTVDSNGNALRPGTYQITETTPSGYLQGLDTIGTVNNAADGTTITVNQIGSIAVTSGQAGINYNFGAVTAITLGGTVYQDTNANGVLVAGDPGVAGIVLTLTGTNNLGLTVTATATTGASGAYTFSTDSNGNLLAPGTYQITETVPTAYVPVAANVGTVNRTLDGTEASPSVINTIVLGSGQNGVSYNFGLSVPAAVTGYLYVDADNDQNFDPSDPALANQAVNLVGTDIYGNSVNLTTMTDGNGYYIFTGLMPGTYHIIVSSPGVLYNPDAVNVGTVNNVTVGMANPSGLEIDQVTLTFANVGVNYNFGFAQSLNVA